MALSIGRQPDESFYIDTPDGQRIVVTITDINRKKTGIAHIAIKKPMEELKKGRPAEIPFVANDKLSGMNQTFYVNQLITLIDADLIDHENEDLLTRLRVLSGLLQAMELPEPLVTA